MKHSYILGINATYHELSAVLLKDGYLAAAAEEERFTRIKHGKKVLIDNPDVIPKEAITFCLKKANIGFADLDHIGLSFCPEKRLKNIDIDEQNVEGDWGSRSGEELFYKKATAVPRILSEFAGVDVVPKCVWVQHHICHAGSAYYVSPFQESAVLAIDGIGETTTTWLG